MKGKDNLSLSLELEPEKIVNFLAKETNQMEKPMISKIMDLYGKNPFIVLVSCLLSLRTRDVITLPVALKLFAKAKTPEEILNIPIKNLETIIYPVGFYKRKAQVLHKVSEQIINKFKNRVPSTEKDLLSLPGVGRKTTNLVLSQAYGIPAICVDTHVHRLSNQLGIVKTQTPLQTEIELKKILPKKYWIDWSRLLVVWGQNKKKKASKLIFDAFK